MYRIDQPTAVGSIPVPAAALTGGYFTGGNPVTGSPATIVDQDWLNRVQEELMTFLASASYTPSKTTYNQVSCAIQSGSLTYAADSSGTANTITVTLNPVPPAYKSGMVLCVKVANTNTGAVNVNVNGLGNVAVQVKGSALVGQELQAGHLVFLGYNSGVFEILSSAGTASVVYTGGTTTGSANAQVTTVSQSGYSLTIGNIVTFKAGFSNTGAATLNINSTGIIAIKKKGTSGLIDVASGDIISGEEYQVIYDGTFYVLGDPTYPIPSTFLQAANNLSDLTNLSAMLSNIGFAAGSGNWFKIPPVNGNPGYIVQCGVFGGGAGTKTLPIAFPNNFIAVVCTDAGSGAFSWGAQPNGLGNFNTFSSGTSAYFIAIGQ